MKYPVFLFLASTVSAEEEYSWLNPVMCPNGQSDCPEESCCMDVTLIGYENEDPLLGGL
jgi:hypothetical protein